MTLMRITNAELLMMFNPLLFGHYRQNFFFLVEILNIITSSEYDETLVTFMAVT